MPPPPSSSATSFTLDFLAVSCLFFTSWGALCLPPDLVSSPKILPLLDSSSFFSSVTTFLVFCNPSFSPSLSLLPSSKILPLLDSSSCSTMIPSSIQKLDSSSCSCMILPSSVLRDSSSSSFSTSSNTYLNPLALCLYLQQQVVARALNFLPVNSLLILRCSKMTLILILPQIPQRCYQSLPVQSLPDSFA